MPSKSPELPLRHMLENIERARAALGDRTPDLLREDWVHFYAVVRCLEIISEASRRLDAELYRRHPEIDWRQVADAGNAYRHGYDAIEAPWVHDTVVDSLPALERVVREELKPFERAMG